MDLLRLALFQPDIPQNAGTLIRLSACLGIALDVVEPCGFLWDEKRMRRAGMDYVDHARVRRHPSWSAFRHGLDGGRLVLLTTAGGCRLDRFSFQAGDVIMVGRESAGVPPEVAAAADAALRIPMAPGLRSLNVAVAAALAVGEALRQLNGYPPEEGVMSTDAKALYDAEKAQAYDRRVRDAIPGYEAPHQLACMVVADPPPATAGCWWWAPEPGANASPCPWPVRVCTWSASTRPATCWPMPNARSPSTA